MSYRCYLWQIFIVSAFSITHSMLDMHQNHKNELRQDKYKIAGLVLHNPPPAQVTSDQTFTTSLSPLLHQKPVHEM
jgi:hypothetical protein